MIEGGKPTWLIPGVKVVAYTTGGAGTIRSTTVTTVDRVAAKTFTVVGEPYRFRIDRMSVTTEPGSVWSKTRHVVPLDSPEGKAEVAAEKQRRTVQRAVKACETWVQNPSSENRMLAIAALQNVQEEISNHDEHEHHH